MSTHKPSGRPTRAGSLHGDLGSVAMRLQDALQYSDIAVWADASGDILYAVKEGCPDDLPAPWLAGVYGVGASAGEIAEDLAVLRRQQVPVDMIG